jgi:tellurite resistance-related uncharacterized protein
VKPEASEEAPNRLPLPADELPADLEAYRRTPEFSEMSVPKGLLQEHSTKAGVWGLIRVVEGQLLYRVTDDRRVPAERLLRAGDAPGVVEPEILHQVEPQGKVRFFVDFFREP